MRTITGRWKGDRGWCVRSMCISPFYGPQSRMAFLGQHNAPPHSVAMRHLMMASSTPVASASRSPSRLHIVSISTLSSSSISSGTLLPRYDLCCSAVFAFVVVCPATKEPHASSNRVHCDLANGIGSEEDVRSIRLGCGVYYNALRSFQDGTIQWAG